MGIMATLMDIFLCLEDQLEDCRVIEITSSDREPVARLVMLAGDNNRVTVEVTEDAG